MKVLYAYNHEVIEGAKYEPGVVEFYDNFLEPPILVVSDDHVLYFLQESYYLTCSILQPFYFMYDVNEFLHRSRGQLLYTVKYYKTVKEAHAAREKRCLEVLPVLNFPVIPTFEELAAEDKQSYLCAAAEKLTDKEMLLLRRILSFKPSKANPEITHEYLFRGAGIETYDDYGFALESLNALERGVENPRGRW